MENFKTFALKASDGTPLYGQSWAVAAPKGVICAVHGLGEHIGRYALVAAFFNQHGYAFLGNDHYGHGQSGGARGHTPSYESLLQEVDALLARAAADFPNVPLYLYGHSMGGNIVLNHLFRRKPTYKAAIATAPAILLPESPPALLLAVGRLMRKIYPKFAQPNGLKLKYLCSDDSVVTAYKNDPLVHDRVTSELGLSLIEQGEWLIAADRTAPVPLLLMHGTADGITAPNGTKQLAAKTSGAVTLKLWDGMLHEIHNEPNKAQVFDAMLQWVDNG